MVSIRSISWLELEQASYPVWLGERDAGTRVTIGRRDIVIGEECVTGKWWGYWTRLWRWGLL